MDTAARMPGKPASASGDFRVGDHVHQLLNLAQALIQAASHTTTATSSDASSATSADASSDTSDLPVGGGGPSAGGGHPFAVDLGQLSDLECVRWAQDLEALSRIQDALAVQVVGEVVQRTDAGRYTTLGIRGPVDMLMQQLKISAREAHRRIDLAEAVLPTRDLITGAVAPTRQPLLAEAFFTGALSQDRALIVAEFTHDAGRLAANDRITQDCFNQVQTQLVTDARIHDPDSLRRIGNRIMSLLDPDGQKPSHADLIAKQGIFFRKPRHGLVGIGGYLTIEQHEQWMATTSPFTNLNKHKDINPTNPNPTTANTGSSNTANIGSSNDDAPPDQSQSRNQNQDQGALFEQLNGLTGLFKDNRAVPEPFGQDQAAQPGPNPQPQQQPQPKEPQKPSQPAHDSSPDPQTGSSGHEQDGTEPVGTDPDTGDGFNPWKQDPAPPANDPPPTGASVDHPPVAEPPQKPDGARPDNQRPSSEGLPCPEPVDEPVGDTDSHGWDPIWPDSGPLIAAFEGGGDGGTGEHGGTGLNGGTGLDGGAGVDGGVREPRVVDGVRIPYPGSGEMLEGLDPIDPESTDPVVKDERTYAQRLLDGVLACLKLASRTDQLPLNGGLKAQLIISVRQEDLDRNDGTGTAFTAYNGPVPLSLFDQSLCDPEITRLSYGEGQEILNVGRTQRLFTPTHRKLLFARDLGCCFPDCTAPALWCEAHHIIPWQDGGNTDMNNAALLCGRHHTLIHHSDWTMELIHGTPHFTAPYLIDPSQTPRRNTYHHGLPKTTHPTNQHNQGWN